MEEYLQKQKLILANLEEIAAIETEIKLAKREVATKQLRDQETSVGKSLVIKLSKPKGRSVSSQGYEPVGLKQQQDLAQQMNAILKPNTQIQTGYKAKSVTGHYKPKNQLRRADEESKTVATAVVKDGSTQYEMQRTRDIDAHTKTMQGEAVSVQSKINQQMSQIPTPSAKTDS